MGPEGVGVYVWVEKGCLIFHFKVSVFLGLSVREVVGVTTQFSEFDLRKIWQPFGVGEVPAPQGKEDLYGKKRRGRSEK